MSEVLVFVVLVVLLTVVLDVVVALLSVVLTMIVVVLSVVVELLVVVLLVASYASVRLHKRLRANKKSKKLLSRLSEFILIS